MVVGDGEEMKKSLRDVLSDTDLAAGLAAAGLETIKTRHTCRHRVDELFAILERCGTHRVVENLQSREAAE